MNAIAFLIAFVMTISQDTPGVRWPPAGDFSAIVVSREMEPIPGATVSLTPCGKTAGATRRTVSAGEGKVAFTNVPPGEYFLTANWTGTPGRRSVPCEATEIHSRLSCSSSSIL
jgi:hypothetical protein